MIKFIHFLKKISFPLVFIILEVMAIQFYAGSSSYTKVKLVTVSNRLAGGVYSRISAVNSYFNLRRENQALTEELAQMQNLLDTYRQMIPEEAVTDSTESFFRTLEREYEFSVAKVVNNTINSRENYITIDKGRRDAIGEDMAILSNGGIAGYVKGTSDKFAVCLSVLNTDFRTSGKLKGSQYAGSIYWDGASSEHVILTEVAKYAGPAVGDTVVTTEYSDKFPPDMLIGTVTGMELINNTYYDIRVKLHANMAALSNVVVVRYIDGRERRGLEETVMGAGGGGVLGR